jgi:hypothetical protein
LYNVRFVIFNLKYEIVDYLIPKNEVCDSSI